MSLDILTESTAKPPQAVRFPPEFRGRMRILGLATAVLFICFLKPLWQLMEFAWGNGLFSHILLVPIISIYLFRVKRPTLMPEPKWAPGLAALPFFVGFAALTMYWWRTNQPPLMATQDYLAVMIFSLLCLLLGVAFLLFGPATISTVAFPLGFFVFMMPLPTFLVDRIETLLQHGSAVVAYWLFQLAGTPVLRQGTRFELPGMPLQVAPECSGIHSSLVLLITSTLAGYIFLRSSVRRAVLALAVLPLALLRNGFRIFVIGELCIHMGPQMIESPIHRRGGPIFFALSLLPFFLLLWVLRRMECQNKSTAVNVPK